LIDAAYGNKIRYVVSVLFSMELIGACVALVVLFADTLNDLFPNTSNTGLKILCGVILLPLSFVPLRVLSLTSILGIASCFGIVSIIVLDGFTKPEAPGSLLQPMPTYWFPQDWWTLPMSFGLLMCKFYPS
jgi:solute carrier family 32 (vesicular inhibitory amino acid transporter)